MPAMIISRISVFIAMSASATIAMAADGGRPIDIPQATNSDIGATLRSPANVTAHSLKIGAPVIGSDGKKIGEINRISASSTGAVTELGVTFGEKAGLDAKTFTVTPEQMTITGGGTVAVSVSSDEVRKATPPNPRG